MKLPRLFPPLLLTLTIAAATIMAGCSDTPPREGEVGLIIGEQQPSEYRPDGGAPAAEIVDGRIVYTAAGSSSCPPIVVSGFHYDGMAVLTVADHADKTCTEDLRGLTQSIHLPQGELNPETAIDIRVPGAQW